MILSWFIDLVLANLVKVNLVTNIDDTCHRDRQITASILQEMIEGFFNRWYGRWAFAIGHDSKYSSPIHKLLLICNRQLHPALCRDFGHSWKALCLQ